MHAIRALAVVLFALGMAPAAAPAAPLRCAEDGDGGACAWGRAEGFDADTVQLRGLRIQLAGIAAPAAHELCGSKLGKDDFPCARLTRRRMGELVGKGVACDLLEVSGGVVLGRCRVAEGDLGRLLVAAGVARAAKDGPYEAEQAAALAAHRGLWSADLVLPRDWEALRRRAEKD